MKRKRDVYFFLHSRGKGNHISIGSDKSTVAICPWTNTPVFDAIWFVSLFSSVFQKKELPVPGHINCIGCNVVRIKRDVQENCFANCFSCIHSFAFSIKTKTKNRQLSVSYAYFLCTTFLEKKIFLSRT